jgi:hypothetical protein
MFVEEATKCHSKYDECSSQGKQQLSQGDPGLFQGQQDQPPFRPTTRVFKNLTKKCSIHGNGDLAGGSF